ncbi:MAG: nuclear transport factor 2 family protein [Methanobrevibacter sp.]|nr:nuclear transport factor 2 family protein [Methanobrevibacter sp.]
MADKVSEREEIIAVVEKYTKGCATGDSKLMSEAFTDNALMYGYLNGEYYNGSINALYEAVDAFGADSNAEVCIDIINVETTIASVQVTLENWHGLNFIDYHSLIKEDGKWRIIAKVFHQYE